jgi:hypothetical protein
MIIASLALLLCQQSYDEIGTLYVPLSPCEYFVPDNDQSHLYGVGPYWDDPLAIFVGGGLTTGFRIRVQGDAVVPYDYNCYQPFYICQGQLTDFCVTNPSISPVYDNVVCSANINSLGLVSHTWATRSQLTATNVPDVGVFIYSDTLVSIPFGNGVRCIGGTINYAWPPVQPNANQELVKPVELKVMLGIGTYYVQAWYRDGLLFNFSNGIEIVIL